MLVGAVVLTMASFATAMLVTGYSAQRIAENGESLSTNAAPSISYLSAMRSELRHYEVLLDDYVDGAVSGQAIGPTRVAIDAAHATIDAAWHAYLALPSYPSEPALWPGVGMALARVHGTADRVLQLVDEHQNRTAEALFDTTLKAMIDVLDGLLTELRELNSRQVAARAAVITTTYARAKSLALLLSALSVALGSLAAWLAARVVRENVLLLENRNAELEQFADRVAHDIMSPLSSTSLALDLAIGRSRDNPAIVRILERGAGGLRRARDISDALLDFARSGAEPERGAHASVAEVLDGVLDDAKVTARGKQIELCVEPFVDCAVACSVGVLTSLLSNLLGNAIKHVGEGPTHRVTVRVADLGVSVRVEVEDSGPGIPLALRQSIFEPFVRLPGTQAAGHGLGLAIVRKLVTRHGGRVGVREAPTAGSIFWFELFKAGEHAYHGRNGAGHIAFRGA